MRRRRPRGAGYRHRLAAPASPPSRWSPRDYRVDDRGVPGGAGLDLDSAAVDGRFMSASCGVKPRMTDVTTSHKNGERTETLGSTSVDGVASSVLILCANSVLCVFVVDVRHHLTSMKSILFLCIAIRPAARWPREPAGARFGDRVRVQSAGAAPARVNPRPSRCLPRSASTSPVTLEVVDLIDPAASTWWSRSAPKRSARRCSGSPPVLADARPGRGSGRLKRQRFREVRDRIATHLRELEAEVVSSR